VTRARSTSVFLVATFALATGVVRADVATIRDARGDPKGAYWPGPGYVWNPQGPCGFSWEDVEDGTCTHADFLDNSGRALDIASIRHGHRGSLLAHRFRTHRSWRASLLRAGGEIAFYFDTDMDGVRNRRLGIRVRAGRLVGIMRRADGRRIGTVRVRRVDRRTLGFTLRRSLLGPSVGRYGWFVFAGIGCGPLDGCGDRAPDTGFLTHDVRSPA
jgi:hypothetical protein